MASTASVVLIVGRPGVGKTTLIERVRTWCPQVTIDGFITREVRDTRGNRIGFDLIDWQTGRHLPLARVDWRDAPVRVGKYGVRPSALDALVETLMRRNLTPPALWVVDELGKMESFSSRFLAWLDAFTFPPMRAVMTSPLRPLPAFRSHIERWRPYILTVTPQNREVIGERLWVWLQRQGLVSSP